MRLSLRFPIRLQILVTMLIVVTGVVGAIVLTMANLFHEDKRTYIKDLVSVITGNAADESRLLLESYQDRLRIYAQISANEEISQTTKADLLRQLFTDFPELVGIDVDGAGSAGSMACNVGLLAGVELDKQELVDDLEQYPVPTEYRETGRTHVRNSTLVSGLPTMTMTLAPMASERTSGRGLAAVIRSDSMMRVITRSEAFEMSLTGSDGRYLAHPSLTQIVRRQQAENRTARAAGRDGVVRVEEYDSQGVEFIGGHAEVGFAGVTVEGRIPKSAAYLASRELLKTLILVALGLLLVSIAVGLVGAYRLTRPVQKLSEAIHDVARGEFTTRVDVHSTDEIGDLAGSFNQMASELLEREEALDEAQAKLIQSEKMAAFGQLGAGIAHEVKNPLAGILGCAQISLKKVESGSPVEKNLRLIEKETKRCKSIIENLLRFARQERALMKPIHINPVVDDALAIIAHQLGMHRVEVQKDFSEDLPMVHGNANQLQQVLMNLIMNAQQAMEGSPGTVRITTLTTENGQVALRVEDNGPGMTDEVRAKLFEPFFTTKPGGKGTGLGLSVSFGILEDHGGKIAVESSPGEGSTFTIVLPKLPDQAAAAADGRIA